MKLSEIKNTSSRGIQEWPSTRAFPTGYVDGTDYEKRKRFKKGRKIDTIVVKEDPLEFTATGDHKNIDGDIWVLVMSNHPDDTYFDDYAGINVIFKKDGSLDYGYSRSDKKAQTELSLHKSSITAVAKRFAKRHNLIPGLVNT